MTAGSVNLKNFSWGALKNKKRHRSGSGGSKDHEAKKKSFLSRRCSAGGGGGGGNSGGRRLSSNASACSNLEIVAPVTADVEFKYTWPIQNFLKQANNKNADENSSSDGLDSQPFEININGVETKWSLSIRFWTGEDGERLANPFVLVLNMLSCKVDKPIEVGIKYKFGVLNRINEEYELGAPETKPDLRLETGEEIKSLGYRNIAVGDKHLNAQGDIQLICKMKLLKDDSEKHSLSSDLKGLLEDEKSSDLILEAGGHTFKVHKNILSARSPVLAGLLHQLDDVKKKEEEEEGKKEARLELKDVKPETLKELLTYIYTDSSSNVDAMANALLDAAEHYKLPGLKNHCEKHFGEILRPNNVASVLLLADKYKCDGLKKSALNYCKDNHTYIMKDENWKTIEEEKPDLFEEAVSEVVEKNCECHTECVKKRGKRFELEKEDEEQE